MEDPWGSPWTADAPPKLDLPAPPPHAHFSIEHANISHSHSHGGTSPQRISPGRSPWDDDDAWGGWNDAKGANSPGWGTSPGLRPLEIPPSTKSPLQSFGMGMGLDDWQGTETRKKEDTTTDSAISLGAKESESKPKDIPLNAEDVWANADLEPLSRSGSLSPPSSEDDAQSSSSEPPAPPTNLALTPGTRPATIRKTSSKVQELVEMYDGIAKRTHSVSPSPIEPPKRVLTDAELVNAVTEGLRGETEDREVDEMDVRDDERDEESDELEVELKVEVGAASDIQEELVKAVDVKPEVSATQNVVAEPDHEQVSESDTETLQEPDEDTWEEGIYEEPVSQNTEVDEEAQGADLENEHTAEQPLAKSISQGLNVQESEAAVDLRENTREEMPERAVDLDSPLAKNEIPERATELDSPQAESTLTPPQRPAISYTTDLSKLDDLFTSVDTSFPDPEPIPDVIIDDTFASISERKAWYRISRPGSMRKHNLGDDENYVRLNWSDSTVRDQAIRIVRRWMEEDSIAGRVVLGRRTAAGGKIFNWDSSAPPVEFAELLRRKSPSRQGSVSSTQAAPAPASPIRAAFGWSSSSSPTIALPPPAPFTSTNTQPKPVLKPSLNTTLQPSRQSFSIPSPTSPLKQPPIYPEPGPASEKEEESTEEEEEEEEVEDDDDWGEMVSSPTGETHGEFSSLADAVEDKPMIDKTGIDSPVVSSSTKPVLAANDLFASAGAASPVTETSKLTAQTDPWGFGDMSFFDKPSGPAQITNNAFTPAPAPVTASAPASTQPTAPFFSSSFMTPLTPIPSPSPPPQLQHKPPPQSPPPTKIDTSKDDELIANILRDLPDLTYMLR